MYMIVINVSPSTIRIRGHAGYAPHGRDVVCAGVTALTQTLLESVERLAGDKMEYEISPGRADIEIKDLQGKSQVLVDSFFIGVKMIADEFPDYVRVEGSNGLDSR